MGNTRWITHLYKSGDERNECPFCHGTQRLETDYCSACGKPMNKDNDLILHPLNSKEIRGQLDYIYSIIENEVRPALASDRWYVYSSLRDEFDQLEILLERNMVI